MCFHVFTDFKYYLLETDSVFKEFTMSSSMLEQAIIDADALKEAAVKTAEQTILEKYSTALASYDSFKKLYGVLKS